MDLQGLFDKVKPYIDQFNAIDLMCDKTAKLPSGAYVKYVDVIVPDPEDVSVIETYDDDRDKEVVRSLIDFFKAYEDLRVETANRIIKILESMGYDDLVMITAKDSSKYLSAPTFDTGAINLTTRRLVDDIFAEDPYTWGFLRCTNEYDDTIDYPFNIRFSWYAYHESSDEGYQMADDTVKQSPKFEPISVVDPEFDTKIRDNFKTVYDFIMHDIDAFFKRNAEQHEELKKQIIEYVNAPDTELGALIYLKEVIDDELS